LSSLNLEVFKSPAAETYVIFGEAKIEDVTQNLAQREFADKPAQANAPSKPAPASIAEEEEEDAEDVDESGLDADEIQTVMSQANCSRSRAVKALKKHANIVDAILELTP